MNLGHSTIQAIAERPIRQAAPKSTRPLALKTDFSGALGIAALGATAVAFISLEAALLPAALIGGAAVLAPRYFARLRGGGTTGMARGKGRKAGPQPLAKGARDIISGWGIGRSAAKTVTFRVISTGLDFGWNYYLLGEVAAAAGLSAFSLAAAPIFYFLHETAWNKFWSRTSARTGSVNAAAPAFNGLSRISPAVAKTITFRTFATISEFGTNYVVVRDAALAAKLSAFGFVAGPFIYLAHEKAWDYLEKHREPPTGEFRPASSRP